MAAAEPDPPSSSKPTKGDPQRSPSPFGERYDHSSRNPLDLPLDRRVGGSSPFGKGAGSWSGGEAGREGQARSALIVLGRDEADRPHASAFGEADAALARKAADIMGMYAIPVETDDLRALAARLPEGRVFASGKAFVPFVKASLFDELLPHLGEAWKKKKVAVRLAGGGVVTSGKGKAANKVAGAATDGNAAPADADAGTGQDASAGGSTSPAAGPAAPKHPTDWRQIGRGSEVLAYEKPGEAWYEAIVVEERAGDLMALKWRDFEGYAVFVRRRDHLGLLHPDLNAA